MVQLDNDFTSLFFMDGNGQKVSADPMSDWAKYSAFSQTKSDQDLLTILINGNKATNSLLQKIAAKLGVS